MFDSLDDTIKRDEQRASTSTERLVRYVVIAAASVLLFGGLIYTVRILS